MGQVRAAIARQQFTLSREQVAAAVRDELPDPLDDLFVVIEGRRFPPKQVISLVTGLDRADFNSHQARRVMSRLGFAVGRRQTDVAEVLPADDDKRYWPYGGRQAEALRPYMGMWVAQKGIEVLVAAETPQEILAWLERHDQDADGMFRVPLHRSETEFFPW